MPTPLELVKRKVFVSGLPVNVSKPEIVEFFSSFGDIEHCQLKLNNKTKRSLGYSCITFRHSQDARRLFGKQVEFKNRICECKKVLSNTQLKEQQVIEKKRKLLLTGIPASFSNEDLRECLEQFRGISHGYVIMDGVESTTNKGFGFVAFDNLESKNSFISTITQHPLVFKGQEIFFSEDLTQPARKQKRTVALKKNLTDIKTRSLDVLSHGFQESWPSFTEETESTNQLNSPKETQKRLKQSVESQQTTSLVSKDSLVSARGEGQLLKKCQYLPLSTKSLILRSSEYCDQSLSNYRLNLPERFVLEDSKRFHFLKVPSYEQFGRETLSSITNTELSLEWLKNPTISYF